MKKITEEQIKAIIVLLEKYNIGIQDYFAFVKMLNELPVVEVKKEDEKK